MTEKVFVLVLDTDEGTTTKLFRNREDAVRSLYQHVVDNWKYVADAWKYAACVKIEKDVPSDAMTAIDQYFQWTCTDLYILNEEEIL